MVDRCLCPTGTGFMRVGRHKEELAPKEHAEESEDHENRECTVVGDCCGSHDCVGVV